VKNDFLEIHCSNRTGAINIPVDQMNFLITDFK